MKCKKTKFVDKAVKSPPSRGAWIEILQSSCKDCSMIIVAPLAGGVD